MTITTLGRIGGAFAVLSFFLSSAFAAPLLPPPTGIAVQYDDFYSYSTKVLDYNDPTAGWDDSAGTGTLDVIITTRSSGQTNSHGDLAPYNIPDPITNPNTNPINDTWGGGGPAGTMLVKDLYNYLWDTFAANTPVFTFDQNETGNSPNLLVTAKVEIVDPVTGVIATWAFDASGDNGSLINSGDNPYLGVYDAADTVTAPGLICLPIGPGGSTVCFDNNKGSGKFDYIVFAPDMNLSLYADNDNLFKVSWAFSDVDDGGEEITLTGRFTPGGLCEQDPTLPQCQVIPEPSPLALAAIGLIGIWIGARRRVGR